jgi:kynureninase
MTGRVDAEQLDAADALGRFRERFEIADADTIYVDGNSLGRLPKATRARLHAEVDDWGARLVTGWHDWIELPARVGDFLGAAVLGARPGEVVACDSTTVNLYKLAAAVMATRPGALVTDRGNFPTDRYVLDGLARAHGRELHQLDADRVNGPQPEDVARAAETRDVALVCLSHVAYRSGALADVERITRESAAPVIWDLSHSAGAVEIQLADWGAELAVGCTYKYLNAGPGAPAYLYVRADRQAGLRTPIQGWFGQRRQFEMDRPYDPEPGLRGFLAGTPPVLQLAAVEEGVRTVAEAGIDALAAKGRLLTSFLVELHDELLAPLGFELATPRDPRRRGAHVCLRHAEAWPITRALIERARVIPDFRGPDSIRFGLPPLYTRFVDVFDAVERLRALVARGEHADYASAPARVT